MDYCHIGYITKLTLKKTLISIHHNAHIVLQMSLTHWVKLEQKYYAPILHQTSSLFHMGKANKITWPILLVLSIYSFMQSAIW